MSPQDWARMSPQEQQQWHLWQQQLAHNEWVRRSAAEQRLRRRAVTQSGTALGLGCLFWIVVPPLVLIVFIAVMMVANR